MRITREDLKNLKRFVPENEGQEVAKLKAIGLFNLALESVKECGDCTQFKRSYGEKGNCLKSGDRVRDWWQGNCNHYDAID
jgi:hypothetical protein